MLPETQNGGVGEDRNSWAEWRETDVHVAVKAEPTENRSRV